MMVSCQLGKLKFHCARKTLFRVEFLGHFLAHTIGFYQKYYHFLNCASVASLGTFLNCFIHFPKLNF